MTVKKIAGAETAVYIYIRASDRKKTEGVRAGGAAHIQCRGFAAAAGGPIPRLRRGAPKRHRRERTATEVAPPHSPYAAPRLTLHVPDVLEEGRLSSALHILYKI